MKSINPKNNKLIKEYDLFDEQLIDQALERSARAYEKHRKTLFSDRAQKINNVAGYLEDNAQSLGKMITDEMGKPVAQAIGEVKKCASLCRYYADNAEHLLQDKNIEIDDAKALVKYLPIGSVFAVMPWNFPFWQVFRFAVPALMAGNVCLLKHASNVPQCALEIERIFNQCGFNGYEFQTLMISASQVEGVIADPRVKAVTLTGSEGAGAKVAAAAGKNLKKSVLELGGSDPFIIMPSANFENTLKLAVRGRIQNNGQTCIAAKRHIIHADVYDKYKDALLKTFEELKVGDPMDDATDVGPLSSPQIMEELDEQVRLSIDLGATRICGAEPIKSDGNYYQPGLLENIPKDSPAYKDELFGPVGLLFKVSSLEEAVDLANDTRFGLGSVICTQDEDEINYAMSEIDAGATFVNAMMSSYPNIPFGGTKSSGYGRELAAEGIHEFCNLKTIYIA